MSIAVPKNLGLIIIDFKTYKTFGKIQHQIQTAVTVSPCLLFSVDDQEIMALKRVDFSRNCFDK